jgi:hypothetical protein
MTTDIVVSESPDMMMQTLDAAGIVSQASEVAGLLTSILRDQNLVANIQGKEHVMVEGWTMLAAMMNHSVGTTGTEPVVIDGKAGFRTHATVYDRNGNVVGSADGICTRGERSWANREDYALSGMAQTRAVSRALRQRFGFVIRLAGYESTPAEEMGYEPPTISDDQQKHLFKIVADNEIAADDAKRVLKQAAGVDSSREIPADKYDAVIDMLKREFNATVE